MFTIGMLTAMALSVLSPAAPGEGSARLLYAQADRAFLNNKQIRMLLIGTEVSHEAPGGPGTAHLKFQADGKVDIRTPKGKTRHGAWRLKGPGVLCLEKLGGRGAKNFCIKLTRDGDEVHHYVPNTGEPRGAAPWVIVKPGPDADQVPSG